LIEQRRYTRVPLDKPASFVIKGESGAREGIARDIAVGGMFVETPTPAGFGANVIVHVELPGSNGPVSLPGVVRWVRDGGMGLQFGLLGAVETHIITEISRKHGG
jgi:type IV pilus assembly protein PilZ